MPAMSMVAMRDGQAETFGGGNNVLAIWKERPSAKTIILTANPDVIYGLGFVDLKDGPVVFEGRTGKTNPSKRARHPHRPPRQISTLPVSG
jgi:hypothetical protein